MKRTFCVIISLIFATALGGCASAPDGGRFSDTRFMLDTVCTVTMGGGDPQKAVSEVFDLVSEIADEIDYYSPDSNVSKFNSAPAGVPVPLTDRCAEIVSAALRVYGDSGGAFDITVAPVKDLWDFKSDDPSVPSGADLSDALKLVGGGKLIFDPENKTLTKTEDGVKIDPGGCGKGYCCSAAIEYIEKNYPDSWAVLDFGGNVGVYGRNPRTDDGSFTVGIRDPKGDDGSYKLTETLTSGMSAVTSGTYQRHFVKDGINYHHILDPKTGMPASNGHESATIICESGVFADCLSTACMVLPEDEGRALAEKYGAKLIYQ